MQLFMKNWRDFLTEIEMSKKRIGDPSYIQDIYTVACKVTIQKTRGGDREQTFTEIRGIPGVTIVTVDPLGTSHDKNSYYSTLILKFELTGRSSPTRYVQDTLFPGLRNIQGLTVRHLGNVDKVEPL